MTGHAVVSAGEWLDARRALLEKEKRITRELDALAAERRGLPWVRVDKRYTFEAPQGQVGLGELFGGHSQLLVYHFMFGPDWKEGCPSCSLLADHMDGALPHLAARDVSLVMVSRAPLSKIEPFKRRMGWRFPWVSSFGGDFNYDYHASFGPAQKRDGKVDYNFEMQAFPSDEAPGASVFYKDPAGQVFHTYSAYGRGLDAVIGAYTLLDMTPKGRDEAGLPFAMAWVRHHDRYDGGGFADADKPYWPKSASLPVEPAVGSSCGCKSAGAKP